MIAPNHVWMNYGLKDKDFFPVSYLPRIFHLKKISFKKNFFETKIAGSEAYLASLVFYNSVKVATAQNVPGAKAIYDALHVRFPHVKRRKDGDANTNSGDAPVE